MLTVQQRQAGIAQIVDDVQRARDAINAQTWFPWEADAKAQQLGAVAIVADTTLRALRNLAAQDTDDADLRFQDLAHTAEESLSAIKGYAAEATFDSVLERTATATAAGVGQLAGSAVTLATNVAGAGVKALWNNIPGIVKLGAAGLLTAAAWFYLRPLLPKGRK